MIKAPAKFKKSISTELKKFIPVIQNLLAKGKATTEEDARIVINDILSDVLGYDKYNELKTEFKSKNDKFDYIVKLTSGPNAKKKEKFDFIIEAKSSSTELSEVHVNQALSYCVNNNIDYFILTNAHKWKLYQTTKNKSTPEAKIIWEVDFVKNIEIEDLADEIYTFSKDAYLDNAWKKTANYSKATDISEIMAVIASDKFIKNICKTLDDIYDFDNVKVVEEVVKENIMKKIFKDDCEKMNKALLKKLNAPVVKTEGKKEVIAEELPPPCPIVGEEKKEAA